MEQFLTEDIQIGGAADEKLQSQLYIGKYLPTVYMYNDIVVLILFKLCIMCIVYHYFYRWQLYL